MESASGQCIDTNTSNARRGGRSQLHNGKGSELSREMNGPILKTVVTQSKDCCSRERADQGGLNQGGVWAVFSNNRIGARKARRQQKASDCCATVGVFQAVRAGLLTRVVIKSFTSLLGLWAPVEAASRMLCSVDIRWWPGSGRTQAKQQLLRPLEDTSVAPSREAHGQATPTEKQIENTLSAIDPKQLRISSGRYCRKTLGD